MQLTTASAAMDAGVSPNQMDIGLLLDADTNVRLGQDHLTHLLSLLGNDLLQTVMAYNAGPKPVTRLSAGMPGADGLLLLESLPGAETRDFVEKVLSNYWIYQRLMDQETPTLDALAEGRPSLLSSEAAVIAPNSGADGRRASAGIGSAGERSVSP
jgi:soluble lytic murein transglycosylase-like protein